MRIEKLLAAALFGAAMTLGSNSQATVLFQDNFNSDSASSALNFNSLVNWSVSDGTIDYVRSGGFGISCVGGTGGCIDMDGSTSNAGRITSLATYSLTAGVLYSLAGQISGNQRGGASDSITFGFVDAVTSAEIASGSTFGIASGAAFSTDGHSILLATDRIVRLYVEAGGGDNIGPILDNVVFSDDRTRAVSEPGTVLLAGLGLLAAAALRRRARSG
jgi:hypothetical protein